MNPELRWIEVLVDAAGGGEPRAERFRGRWMLPPEDANWSRLPGHPMSTCYGVAAGEGSSLFVYSYHLTELSPRRLQRHRSVAAALAAGVPADVIAQAVGADRTRADRALAAADGLFKADAVPVLLVSGDPGRTHGFRRELEADGYLVRLAADAKRALQAIRRRPPDVVFVDLTDGLEDPDSLRPLLDAGRRPGSPPVILISSRAGSRAGARHWRFQLPDPGRPDALPADRGGALREPPSAPAA